MLVVLCLLNDESVANAALRGSRRVLVNQTGSKDLCGPIRVFLPGCSACACPGVSTQASELPTGGFRGC